ncbi:MAG: alanine dehydrogenase [Saprospiraceae bacterium]
MSQRKVQIPDSLRQGQFSTQEELLTIPTKKSKLYIGIPKEEAFQEKRIALAPTSIESLVSYGHHIVVESGAGEASNFSNHNFSEAGAEIAYSKETVFNANIILKVAPLTLEEIEYLKPNQIVISPIHLPTLTEEYIYRLKQKRVIALAWEYIKDESDTFPLVRTLSEMAGISSMLTAAELLSSSNNGRGVLLGGITGVPPSKVVILGAGVVAEFATKAAIGLGAEVRVFDNNIYKLMRLQKVIHQPLYTSAIIPRILARELYSADVVIGAVHSKSGRTPVIVSESMVEKMREGSVIIDVSIDQGGCFATSRLTTHDKPTFRKHGVIHYCVPNISSNVSRTASFAVSNILTPMLLKAADASSFERVIYKNAGLRHGIYIYKGSLTNSHIGQRFNIKTTNLDLLISSSS